MVQQQRKALSMIQFFRPRRRTQKSGWLCIMHSVANFTNFVKKNPFDHFVNGNKATSEQKTREVSR